MNQSPIATSVNTSGSARKTRNNRDMARGWESKSVESQMEAAEARQADRNKVRLTDKQVQFERERDALIMSRKRVETDLERAVNPRYRQQLQAALAHLDTKLAALQNS